MLHGIIVLLLIVGAHFSLTPFAPAQPGKASLIWPFALDSKPIIRGIGGLAQPPASLITRVLAAVAGIGFITAAVGLFGVVVPAEHWRTIVLGTSAFSVALYGLYLGPRAALPLLIDAVMLFGVLALGWTVEGLRGM